MNSIDSVTDFVIRHDWYETPLGTFPCSEQARQACLKSDFDPQLCTTHRVEMATIHSLLKAINTYCGHLADEYDFLLNLAFHSRTIGEESKVPIPERFRWLIAFAVEGGSEGYYVHVGAMLDGGQFQEFGLAKTNTSESAYELAKQAGRFLAAALWN